MYFEIYELRSGQFFWIYVKFLVSKLRLKYNNTYFVQLDIFKLLLKNFL